jgi:hypothetical protein
MKAKKLVKPAMRNKAKSSVVDPDPVRSVTFGWIRIRLIKLTITQQIPYLPVLKKIFQKYFLKSFNLKK